MHKTQQLKVRGQRRSSVSGSVMVLLGAIFFMSGTPTLATAQEADAASSDYLYIAGLAPSQRPEAAPMITEMTKDAEWYAQALYGVSEPYPNSLKFLEDQGAWWTPFIHPGMAGRFDIRGRHAAD